MSDIHVTYDGDTYWLQCFRDDPSTEKGILIGPVDVGDSWAALAGKVTEHEAQHGCSPAGEDASVSGSLRCADCGTGTAEPEAAKVIVVERDGHPARLFAASTWEVLHDGPEHGDLVLRDKVDDTVAQLGARMWDSACDAEAILPADLYARQGKKLAIALDALRKIDQDGDDYSARAAAEEALANIADVDL